jgi:hypothetical protein
MANFVAFQLDAFQNDAFQTYVVEVSIEDLRRFTKMYALAEDGTLVALSAEQTAVAFSTLNTVVSLSTTNAMFVQHKPRRDAPSEIQ